MNGRLGTAAVVLAALLALAGSGCGGDDVGSSHQAVVFDGQSLNNLPRAPDNYPTILMAEHPSTRWANVAVNGVGWAGLAPSAAQRLNPKARLASDTVLVMLGGEDDLLAGATGQEVYDREVAYANAARAAGFDKVILCTIPGAALIEADRSAEKARVAHNEIAQKDPDDAFDAVVDLDTPPLSWEQGSPYYAKDQLHPSKRGAEEIAERVDDALSKILEEA